MNNNKERVVLVTGGNSGIGKAIAQFFCGQSKVVIVGRDEERLQSTAEELGNNVTWIKADVANREQVKMTIDTIKDKFEKLDVLVNNAGYINATTTDMSLEEAEEAWDGMVNTILKGSYLMSMAAAPILERPGGRMINISSIAALTGGRNPGAAGYAAAKAGLHGLTYGLARELSPQGITVNTVAPGFIADTGFTGNWPDQAINGIVQQTLVNRAGHVNDIASAVGYLSSPEASFVNGEIFNVNGGWVFGRG